MHGLGSLDGQRIVFLRTGQIQRPQRAESAEAFGAEDLCIWFVELTGVRQKAEA
jgi:hypothetical protein